MVLSYALCLCFLIVTIFVLCFLIIEELQKGAKHPLCNSDFINKIEGTSNTEFSQPQLV